MDHSHNIRLSQQDSQRLYHDMTHIDRENQDRINAFMSEIDNNISIHEDGDRISANSKSLNMAAILQLLQDDPVVCNGVRDISSSVTMKFQECTTANDTNEPFLEAIPAHAGAASFSVTVKSNWSIFDVSFSTDLPFIA